MDADHPENAAAASFESPEWHADVLRERELRVAEGNESFIDWEDAKEELRKRFEWALRFSQPTSM